MEFWEAMKVLQEGGKVKRKSWNGHLYIEDGYVKSSIDNELCNYEIGFILEPDYKEWEQV